MKNKVFPTAGAQSVKLLIIAALSLIVSIVIFATAPGQNRSSFDSMFGIALMSGLVFICLAINFFAISFLVKRIRNFFA